MQNIFHYDLIIKKFRDFFQSKKKFIEVPAQSRLSILAACEDPKTISVFNFNNIDYPLPQTGQMWLEYELLKNPNVPGVFCITTSYRNEPNPIPGRHDKIFPMFEFESHGSIKDLRKLIVELLEHFGFEEPVACLYNDMCKKYQVDTLEAEHETAGGGMSEIRKLSNNFTPPTDACETYKISFKELKEFEEDLHRHVHLENNILFPKAIDLEERLF